MDIMIDFNDKEKREEIHQLLKQGIEEVGEQIKTEVDTRTLEALEKLIGTQEKIIEDYEQRIAMMSKHGLWISVEERLPEIKEGNEYFGTHCIVCDKYKQVLPLRYCLHDVRGKEVHRWVYEDFRLYYGEVVYWMPYPEPPKEGDV